MTDGTRSLNSPEEHSVYIITMQKNVFFVQQQDKHTTMIPRAINEHKMHIQRAHSEQQLCPVIMQERQGNLMCMYVYLSGQILDRHRIYQ